LTLLSLLKRLPDRDLNYGREQLAEFFANQLAPPTTALDLGLGDGCDLRMLRDSHPQTELHGIDFRSQKLEAARAAGITPHQLDLETCPLPFPDEYFDVIIANQIFEHLKNFTWCMHQCCRVLRLNGCLVAGVPNLASLHNRLLLLCGRQPTAIRTLSGHVRGFTRREFADAVLSLSSGSLALVAHWGANFYPLPRQLARLGAKLLPGMAVSSFFVFQKTAPYDGSFYADFTAKALETLFFDHSKEMMPRSGFEACPLPQPAPKRARK